MINSLIAISVRRRSIVVLIAIACAAIGIHAAIQTPMDAVPDLSENQVIVFADWPGHGPREVEEQVTYPLSSQIQGLQGVRVVRGSSDIGRSMLYVIFDDYVTLHVASRSVQERLCDRLESGPSLGDVVPRRLLPTASQLVKSIGIRSRGRVRLGEIAQSARRHHRASIAFGRRSRRGCKCRWVCCSELNIRVEPDSLAAQYWINGSRPDGRN